MSPCTQRMRSTLYERAELFNAATWAPVESRRKGATEGFSFAFTNKDPRPFGE